MNDFEQYLRKFFAIFLTAIFIGIFVFIAVVPGMLDKQKNAVVPHALYPLSDRAARLHASIEVADLHADSLLWPRDMTERHTYGHLDLPRLIDGNIALQVFSIVSKVPSDQNYERNSGDTDVITLFAMANLWDVSTWGSLKERALYQAERLNITANESGGVLRLVKTSDELQRVLKERSRGRKVIAGLLSTEGAHILDRDIGNLDSLVDAGVTIYGITHFFDNFLAGSAHGMKKGGLTKKGKEFVREIERRHLILDVAHLSPAAIDDVLSIAKRPVLVSHTGVKGTCNKTRNLSDEHLQKIAANGGLVGVGLWEEATCGKDLRSTANAINYVARRLGVDYVALGSDWDGSVDAFINVSEVAALTHMLIEDGFSDSDVAKIMGGNTIRFLSENLPE